MSGWRALGMADDRRGFILVAVLWLLVALGAVGIHAGLDMRTERLAAANVLDGVRARQAALAGAEYARSRLSAAMLDRADELRAEAATSRGRRSQSRTLSVERLFRTSDPMEDPWRDPEELVITEMEFGDARFTLRMRDAGAALNLNAADEDMLRSFFSLGLGLDYNQADRLAQAILDWRDEDDLPRLGGAEREEYLRAGAPMLPANRPFGALEELRHVMGMTEAIYQAALPHLTLRSSGRVNLNAAPRPVLLALPGMTEAAADEILRLRETGVFPSAPNALFRLLPAAAAEPLRAAGQRLQNRVAFRTDEVEIISEGSVEGSLVHARIRTVVVRSEEGALVVNRAFDP